MITGGNRTDLRNELMDEEGIKILPQFIHAVLVGLKFVDPHPFSQGIHDIVARAIVTTIDISVTDDENGMISGKSFLAQFCKTPQN
jgi:hypothetical protein